jgi:SAM-dependent methyltransferase/uncharacterized protein YbaR (Trm112 family)
MTSVNSDYLKLNPTVLDQLRCPICRSPLTARGASLECEGTTCLKKFPIVDGIPVLINEQNSVFAIEDFANAQKRSLGQPETSNRLRAVEQRIWNMLPTINRNLRGHENYAKFAELIIQQAEAEKPQVLVIGAGPEKGEGMESLVNAPAIHLVETDVAFGPTTALVCDAHDIPFCDGSFDGVIVQAVLEHVADPYRCVSEIYRVLKPNGLVYAETPFMQQVHMGPYDFTRFTHLGHRRLFRHFAEVESGIACGPGMALAWSYQYFLISFARSRTIRGILKVLALLTSFFLQYLDPYAARTPAAFDAASGFYFIGRKSGSVLSDRELVSHYRGAVWSGR